VDEICDLLQYYFHTDGYHISLIKALVLVSIQKANLIQNGACYPFNANTNGDLQQNCFHKITDHKNFHFIAQIKTTDLISKFLKSFRFQHLALHRQNHQNHHLSPEYY